MKNLIPRFIAEQYENNNFHGSFVAYTMFVDISVFTHLTEIIMSRRKGDAEILTEILNNIFEPIISNIYGNGGFISNFAGDAFTAIFEDKAGNEFEYFLQSISFIINSFKENKEIYTKYGNFKMGIKIGLSYGELDWGILGKKGKYTYYFRGESIDGCAKSEHRAQVNEIVCDSYLLEKLEIKFSDLTKIFEYISYFDLPLSKSAVKYYKLDFNKDVILPQQNLSFKLEIKKKILKAFMLDATVDFSWKAEFREIVTCFISFKEPASVKKLDNFATKIIEESYQYGGYFNKIDFGDKGSVILVVFGAPISYENNLERALDFCLKLKDIVTIDFKIGLTLGYVYAGIMGGFERCEYTVIGDIVNLSSRIMVRAEWNEIWASQKVFSLMKGKYQFGKVGEFLFKGKEKQVAVYKFGNKKKYSSLFEGDIVGRKNELKKLKEFITPIYHNSFAGICYVYGEAGIGKSRLLHAFKNELDANWFSLPCEQILQKSLNPILYFLKKYFNILDKNSLDEKYDYLVNFLEKDNLSKNIKNELLRTKSIVAGYLGIEWEGSLFSELKPQKRYENFLSGVKNLFQVESLISPIILILEDVHWIDNDSKIFMEMLINNSENFPIAIIATARYLTGGSRFKFKVGIDTIMDEINLDFLERKYISKYCKMVLKTKDEISEEFLNFIYDKTNGNPFFIEQILLDLQNKNIIEKHSIGKKELFVNIQDLKKIPNNIQAIIISRLDSLPPVLRDIIQTAAVIGRKFNVEILKDIFNNAGNADSFYEKLEQITKEMIWIPLSNGNFIFKHILLSDVAYDMQLRSKLRQTHKSIAQSYEVLFEDDLKKYYADIAHHYNQSDDTPKAIEYLEKAGDFAKDNYKNEDAIDLYNILLDKKELDYLHFIEILFKKASILELVGRRKEAEKIYRKCLDLSQENENIFYLAKSQRFIGLQLINNGEYNAAKSFFGNSLKLYETMNDKIGIGTIFSDIGTIYHQTGKYDKAKEFYQKSLNIAQEMNDKYLASRVFCNIGIIQFKQGDYEKALNSHKESLKLLNSIKDQYRIAITIGNMGDVYSSIGDYKRAIEYYEKNLKIAERLGDKEGISATVSNIGVLYHQQGKFLEAEKYYLKGQKLFQKLDDKQGMNRIIGNMGLLYKTLGDYDKAMECYEKYLKICKDMNDTEGVAGAFINIGNVYKDWHKYDKAMQYYEKALIIYKEMNSKWAIGTIFGNMGIVYKALGDYKKAMEYYEKNLKISEELGDKKSISMVIGNMGAAYANQGFYNKALECYEKQIKICKEIDYKRGSSIVIGNIGNLYYKQHKYLKAIKQYDETLEICFDINFIGNNPEWLNGKAKCLYELQRYEESQICNRDCCNNAKEMKNENFIFLSNVLAEKNKFMLAENESDKKYTVARLKKMIELESDKQRRSYVKYQIFFMLKELHQYNSKYKQELIYQYNELYEKTFNIEYREKLETLGKS